AVGLLGVALLLAAAISRGRITAHITSDRWKNQLGSLRQGLDCLRSRRVLITVTLLTIATWSAWMLGAWCVARSLGIGLSVSGVVFLFAILALGSAVPSAPGFVGTFDWIAANGLALLGVSKTQSVAFALVLHSIWFVPTTIIGICSMLHIGIGLST